MGGLVDLPERSELCVRGEFWLATHPRDPACQAVGLAVFLEDVLQAVRDDRFVDEMDDHLFDLDGRDRPADLRGDPDVAADASGGDELPTHQPGSGLAGWCHLHGPSAELWGEQVVEGEAERQAEVRRIVEFYRHAAVGLDEHGQLAVRVLVPRRSENQCLLHYKLLLLAPDVALKLV